MTAPVPAATRSASFLRFVHGMTLLLDPDHAEEVVLASGARLMADLVARDDWLPGELAAPAPHHYRQYLLHLDAAKRFSVVSFVWGPGQGSPIHNHGTWGLIGVLRGAERVEGFTQDATGRLARVGPAVLRSPGEVDQVSPRVGDIHRVENALADGVSISIHCYGADIAAVERSAFELDGTARSFVSRYSDPVEAQP